ncbi:MAG: YraN family protein [Alphaproteobacteria bacterium]|nr:YraN family protein [Alphaproteobacteria bacterium]
MKKRTNYKTGHFAEKITALLLICKGYRPIACNFVTGRGTGAGEIDLIMKHGKTLVFVEVKKRKDYITAAEAITQKNQLRTSRASEAFLRRYPQYSNCQIRYDAVLFFPKHWPVHIKDAWRL